MPARLPIPDEMLADLTGAFVRSLARDGVHGFDGARIGYRMKFDRVLKATGKTRVRHRIGRFLFARTDEGWTLLPIPDLGDFDLDMKSLVPDRTARVRLVQLHATVDGREMSAEVLGGLA